MSHELRTPLNSMLILSKMLSENAETNLNEKQVEFAETIHSSGADLLALINEILDLSKIESGAMGVEIANVHFGELKGEIERIFEQVAQDKGLELVIDLDKHLPETMETDPKRLGQVLKNLLSNAFKFTAQGQVGLKIITAESGWSFDNENLNRASSVLAFHVTDTGIGIPEDKQQLIFEAFQQADGTTSRKYGGTGLGLSISREIARLLGGEIKLESKPGEGSTFTFFLPEHYEPVAGPAGSELEEDMVAGNGREVELLLTFGPEADARMARSQVAVLDDRSNIEPDDKVMLVIEDDSSFARILVDIAHEQGFKCLVSQHGEDALLTARKYRPDAITLDLKLPGMHGFSVLDRLKHDPSTRHIPIQTVSVLDDVRRVLKLGALGHITKPAQRENLIEGVSFLKDFVERPVKRLLLIEDDEVLRRSINELIGGEDVTITSVGTGEEALKTLESESFDCAIVDLMLPDMEWSDLIGKIKRETRFQELPIIVHTGKDLSKRETAKVRKMAETIILKDADSMERLVDETALFLHRDVADLSESQKNMIKRVNVTDPRLTGKKVLVVDDDIRNIFALTSILERQQMQVVYAENGQDGIDMLKKSTAIDGVLMDIMMPGMDGYQAMHEIRQITKFKAIPIIAVTAKAMKGDRQKCIEAGASDYITKPVETEQLLSLLRIWLDR
jgi:CheY-like chemotaxis protein/two-component sensor histidine kinase